MGLGEEVKKKGTGSFKIEKKDKKNRRVK